ncbi:hypothetical protein MOO46_07285 [Apilactobacillus apisilvae]|uniref:Uncharacterized protein n=1 Tax=Apilactobacillus apisilvae TaxID=2923364 RepID=A0ABY4PGT5_9LACO|nr:hypothetical protein [Apilactobacillus apisilvae]UQS85024.1 hypothetical protein MOO46_07285 [Apilactobacillus apisilvae]
MKKNKMAMYASMLSDLISGTNETGEKMSKDYEPLEKAMDKSDLSGIDLVSTKKTFQDGTNTYKTYLDKLSSADVPAKTLGMHSNLKSAYANYVKGCQDMVDSIKDDDIDKDSFNQAGDLQQTSIEKVFKYAQKIMITA